VRSIRLLGLVLILFCLDRHVPYLRWRVPSLLTDRILNGDFFLFVKHCFIFRLSNSTVFWGMLGFNLKPKLLVIISVADPRHFGVDPDPRIHASD
jgi:hypothetical protein